MLNRIMIISFGCKLIETQITVSGKAIFTKAKKKHLVKARSSIVHLTLTSASLTNVNN